MAVQNDFHTGVSACRATPPSEFLSLAHFCGLGRDLLDFYQPLSVLLLLALSVFLVDGCDRLEPTTIY